MFRLIVLLCGLVSSAFYAEVKITDATIRLLPPGVPNTAAYFSVENHFEKRLTLVGAEADFVGKAEIHNHVMIDGMMRMQHQTEVVLQPGERVEFAPGGLHIMLFELKQPLQEAQLLQISLQTKEGESIIFTAKVARPSAHSHH